MHKSALVLDSATRKTSFNAFLILERSTTWLVAYLNLINHLHKAAALTLTPYQYSDAPSRYGKASSFIYTISLAFTLLLALFWSPPTPEETSGLCCYWADSDQWNWTEFNQNNVLKDTKMPKDLMETAESHDNRDNHSEIPLLHVIYNSYKNKATSGQHCCLTARRFDAQAWGLSVHARSPCDRLPPYVSWDCLQPSTPLTSSGANEWMTVACLSVMVFKLVLQICKSINKNMFLSRKQQVFTKSDISLKSQQLNKSVWLWTSYSYPSTSTATHCLLTDRLLIRK